MTGDGGKGNLSRKGGRQGSASAGKGEKLFPLLSPERGLAPLPSGAEEGKADARRWAEFEEWWDPGLDSALFPQAASAGSTERSLPRGTVPVPGLAASGLCP